LLAAGLDTVGLDMLWERNEARRVGLNQKSSAIVADVRSTEAEPSTRGLSGMIEEMVIHHGKPADADREDLCEFLDPVFDPRFSIGRAFSKQKRASDAPARAVIPAGHG
jgi:hypothetical protein